MGNGSVEEILNPMRMLSMVNSVASETATFVKELGIGNDLSIVLFVPFRSNGSNRDIGMYVVLPASIVDDLDATAMSIDTKRWLEKHWATSFVVTGPVCKERTSDNVNDSSTYLIPLPHSQFPVSITVREMRHIAMYEMCKAAGAYTICNGLVLAIALARAGVIKLDNIRNAMIDIDPPRPISYYHGREIAEPINEFYMLTTISRMVMTADEPEKYAERTGDNDFAKFISELNQ